MQICLEDYHDSRRRSLFDLSHDCLVAISQDSVAERFKPQGFFSYRKLGMFQRQRELIAVFSVGEALRMAIGTMLFNLSDPAVIAKRRGAFFGVMTFSLWKSDLPIVIVRYWDTSWALDDGDIFEYCERVTASAESKSAFLRIWNAVAAGKEISRDFLYSLTV